MRAIVNNNFDGSIIHDEQVFKDLYRQYFVKLYRFSLALINLREPAEEIAHDVLMKLWKNRGSFTDIRNLDAYLYVSVKNLSLNYLRDQQKLPCTDIEQLYDSASYITADPETLMISAEKIEQLNECINNLPAKCKLIFKLVKEDGLKYKDTAKLLNISVKTVENQLIIALKKITAVITKNK